MPATLATWLLAPAGPGGCGPAGPPPESVSPLTAQAAATIPDPLGVYRGLGFITGERTFPAVGRFAYLPGPGDSTYAIVSFSMPNSALRFRRDARGFLARYRVEVTVGDSAAPAAQLDESEEVRVNSFRETSRRDESVVFQASLKLLPGAYAAKVRVTDLGSSAGLATVATPLSVPRFGTDFITAPLVVYEAKSRASRDQPPALIVNPRATIEMEGGRSRAYVESGGAEQAATLETVSEGQVISADTLALRPPAAPLRAATLALEGERLAPGAVTLRVRGPDGAPRDSARLLVALSGDWVVRDYSEAVDYLRYAGTAAQLDSLRRAPPGERARVLHAFWKRKDPVPGTAENEFFEGYFGRLRDANERFAEVATAGWLTDRGAVYVTFGPPEEVLRQLKAGEELERAQVWLYEQSLGFRLRLVFTDPTGTGAFRLTEESRRMFRAAIERFYR